MITILAALALAVPVHCYPTDTGWRQAVQDARTDPTAIAFYDPGVRIAVGPFACREIRRPTLLGARILAHELAHHWQWWTGRTFDEPEADRIADRADNHWLAKIEKALGRKAKPPPWFVIVLQP
jgi:hypothetical protein